EACRHERLKCYDYPVASGLRQVGDRAPVVKYASFRVDRKLLVRFAIRNRHSFVFQCTLSSTAEFISKRLYLFASPPCDRCCGVRKGDSRAVPCADWRWRCDGGVTVAEQRIG